MPRAKDNTPYLLRPPRSLVARLEKLAKEYGRDSSNQVAVEILDTYAEFWAEGEQARVDAIKARQDSLRAAIQAEVLSAKRNRPGSATPCAFCSKGSESGICEDCQRQLTAEPKMAQDKLNDLPYGAIQLNQEGTVIAYNKGEEEISRISHKKIIGKNFFTQIAPCSDVKEFHGQYDAFLRGSAPSEEFSFSYAFSPRRTVHVLVKFLRVDATHALVISRRAETQIRRKRA